MNHHGNELTMPNGFERTLVFTNPLVLVNINRERGVTFACQAVAQFQVTRANGQLKPPSVIKCILFVLLALHTLIIGYYTFYCTIREYIWTSTQLEKLYWTSRVNPLVYKLCKYVSWAMSTKGKIASLKVPHFTL